MFSCKTNCEEVDISQARRLQSSKRTGNFEKRCYSEAEVTFATRSASSQILSAQCTRRQSDLRPRFFYQPGVFVKRGHTREAGLRRRELLAISNTFARTLMMNSSSSSVGGVPGGVEKSMSVRIAMIWAFHPLLRYPHSPSTSSCEFWAPLK